MVLKLIYTIMALEFMGMGLLLPSIGTHLHSLGSSHVIIGLLGSAFALVQLISNPIIGSLSDIKGRKPILLQTLALGVVSYMLLALSSASVFGIFVSRILTGFANQSMVLLKAIVADFIPSSEQAAVYGKMGAFGALGFIVGPIVGGNLLELPNGFYNISLILVGLVATNFGLALLLPNSAPIKKQSEKKKDDSSVMKKAYSELAGIIVNLKSINWEIFWDLFALKFLVESSLQTFYSSFALVLIEEFSCSQKEMGYTMAFHALLMIVFNLVMGTIRSKFYSRDQTGVARVYHALIVLSLSFLGLFLSPSYWIYAFFLMPISGVRTLIETTWTEVLVLRVGDGDKGTVMGAFESVTSLAGLVIPLITGIVIDVWGIRAPALLCTIPAFAGFIIANKMGKSAVKTE